MVWQPSPVFHGGRQTSMLLRMSPYVYHTYESCFWPWKARTVKTMLVEILPLHWITLEVLNPPSTLPGFCHGTALQLDYNFYELWSMNVALKHLHWNRKDFAQRLWSLFNFLSLYPPKVEIDVSVSVCYSWAGFATRYMLHKMLFA